jgi:hypothetical protein
MSTPQAAIILPDRSLSTGKYALGVLGQPAYRLLDATDRSPRLVDELIRILQSLI